MKNIYILSILQFWAFNLFAIRSLYIGGNASKTTISSNTQISSSVAYGADLGARIQRTLDLSYHLQGSNHTGESGLELLAQYITLNVIPFPTLESLEPSVGIGPGLYLVSNGNEKATKLGINFGATVDFKFEQVRIGIFSRYHIPRTTEVIGSFYDFGLRFGYAINL